MKTLKLFFVLLTVFILTGCDSHSVQKDTKSHKYLIVLPNAENFRNREIDETYHILYNIKEEYPASKSIASIENQLKSLGFKQLKHDELNFNAPTSSITGWAITKQGASATVNEAHIWLSVWNNNAGDYLKYHFQYLTPTNQIAEQDLLMVGAIFVPAKKANEILDQVKNSLEKN